MATIMSWRSYWRIPGGAGCMAALFQIIQCRTSVARSFWIIDRLSKLCVRLIWIMWAPQASAAFRIPRRPAWRIDSSGNRRTVAALLDSACPLLGVVRSQEFPPPPLQANASRPTIRRPMSRAPALVGRPRTQSETPASAMDQLPRKSDDRDHTDRGTRADPARGSPGRRSRKASFEVSD